MHEVCSFDDDPMCLDEVFKGDLVTRIPLVEQVESCRENGCIDDKLLLQKKFEEEFNKFCEMIIVEKQKIHLIMLRKWSTLITIVRMHA